MSKVVLKISKKQLYDIMYGWLYYNGNLTYMYKFVDISINTNRINYRGRYQND